MEQARAQDHKSTPFEEAPGGDLLQQQGQQSDPLGERSTAPAGHGDRKGEGGLPPGSGSGASQGSHQDSHASASSSSCQGPSPSISHPANGDNGSF